MHDNPNRGAMEEILEITYPYKGIDHSIYSEPCKDTLKRFFRARVDSLPNC
jgi:hypothetical protein